MNDEKNKVCSPTDGFFKPDHPECQDCHYKSKRICQIFREFHHGDDPVDVYVKRDAKDTSSDETDDVIDNLDAFIQK